MFVLENIMVRVIDRQTLSLADWLQLLHDEPQDVIFPANDFPNEQALEEYCKTIGERSTAEFDWLVSKLLPAPLVGKDKLDFQFIREQDLQSQSNVGEYLGNLPYQRKRLVLAGLSRWRIYPRDSIEWITGLLDSSPEEAVSVVRSYLHVFWMLLTDSAISGSFDLMEIIRARYLSAMDPGAVLDSISPRDLEHLVERLYCSMGYETTLTRQSRDGGRDVEAKLPNKGSAIEVLVDAKQYTKPVGVQTVRTLAGLLEKTRVNKVVLVATNRFTKDAIEFARDLPRVELIGRKDLVVLLSQYCGMNWWRRIDELIVISKRHDEERTLHCADVLRVL